MNNSSGSSPIFIIIAAILGMAGVIVLLVKLISGAGNIHPLICWHISPLYDASACLAESTKFD